jgi:hypothetical protein
LRVDEQQLAGGEPDGVDFGPDQVLRRGEVVFGERRLDLVGEAGQVAGALRAAELDDLLPAGRGQRPGGGPALQQPQDPGRAQVLPGDGQRGGEGGEQVGAQPVQQPPLIPAGPLAPDYSYNDGSSVDEVNTTWSFASREMQSGNGDASADIDVVTPIPMHHLMIMVPAVPPSCGGLSISSWGTLGPPTGQIREALTTVEVGRGLLRDGSKIRARKKPARPPERGGQSQRLSTMFNGMFQQAGGILEPLACDDGDRSEVRALFRRVGIPHGLTWGAAITGPP